jgi:class 3 adenylate cyclase
VKTYIKLKQILNILVPQLVRDRITNGKKNYADEEGEPSVIYVIIENFDEMISTYKPKELISSIDKIFKQFDTLCDQHGIMKIESIGKRFLACAGLKTADRQIDSNFLNKHHSVRVTDFALDILQVA